MSYRCSSAKFPDIWDWINGLPPPLEWKADTMSLRLCSCSPETEASLLFSVRKSRDQHSGAQPLLFSLVAEFRFPLPLWTSQPCITDYSRNLKDSTGNGIPYTLFLNFIGDVLHYGPADSGAEELQYENIQKQIDSTVAKSAQFGEVFRCAFVCLCMCVFVYEAPTEIRSCCLEELEGEFQRLGRKSNVPAKLLLQALGTNLEEHLMRSMALMITNRMFETLFTNLSAHDAATWDKSVDTCTPLVCSYSDSRIRGFWKVRVYAPMLCAKDSKPHGSSTRDQLTPAPKDENLMFALRYQHVEAVLQFRYGVNFSRDWIEVRVHVDNVRCDVSELASADLMEKRGVADEKHFPSRICVSVVPERQSEVLMVSLNKSSDNPTHEISSEKTLETGFEAPSTYGALRLSSTEGSAMTMRPWKYEQSVRGNGGSYEWILHDPSNGKEVASSKPSKMMMWHPKAWFKNRYSTAYRAFTKDGGVVFAGDEYSEPITWRVKPQMEGHVLKLEVGGCIWVTYWPNKYRTFYCETRLVEFADQVELPLVR